MIIDDKALSALATKSILDLLTPEAKEELLQKTVASFFETVEVPSNVFGAPPSKKTKVQVAFDEALASVMHGVIFQILREPETLDKLRDRAIVTLDKYLQSEDSEALTEKLFRALNETFRR